MHICHHPKKRDRRKRALIHVEKRIDTWTTFLSVLDAGKEADDNDSVWKELQRNLVETKRLIAIEERENLLAKLR